MNALKLMISDIATDDLTNIWLYIAVDSIPAADRFIELIHEKCHLLRTAAEVGCRRDDLLIGMRCLPLKRYLIFYRQNNCCREIIRIVSGYRDLNSLF